MKKLVSIGNFAAGLAMLSINTVTATTSDHQLKLPGNDERPNFVFILVDDMAWYGTSVRMDTNLPASGMAFCSMPNVRKLSEQGIVFSHARAAAAMCGPSRCSIQTPFLSLTTFCGNSNYINIGEYTNKKIQIRKSWASAVGTSDTSGTYTIGPLPVKAGYTYYVRVGANVNALSRRYNYSPIVKVVVP